MPSSTIIAPTKREGPWVFSTTSSSRGGGQSSLIALAAKNPEVVAAIASLLSNKTDSVGGTGGLGAMMSAFGKSGLGDVIGSWVGTGQNQAIDPDGALGALLGR